MKGKIISQQVCSVCKVKGKYEEVPGVGLRCQCGCTYASLYEIQITINGNKERIRHDKSGNRIDGYNRAQRLLEVIRNDIDNRIFRLEEWKRPACNSMVWKNYCREYLAREKIRLGDSRKASYDKKKALCNYLLNANWGSIRNISTADVEDFFLLPEIRERLAPKTLADLAQELRHIFNKAVDREDIHRSPKVPVIKVPEKPIDWLSVEEQKVVLEHIDETHRPIFEFLFIYGVRVSEACTLFWDVVDRTKNEFHINRTLSRRKLKQTTKGRHYTTLPILPPFAKILDKLEGKNSAAPVFKNPKAKKTDEADGRYTPDFVRHIWRKALASAGMRHIDLKNGSRHSLGMQMTGAGRSDRIIARALGHSSTAHVGKYAQASVLSTNRTVRCCST